MSKEFFYTKKSKGSKTQLVIIVALATLILGIVSLIIGLQITQNNSVPNSNAATTGAVCGQTCSTNADCAQPGNGISAVCRDEGDGIKKCENLNCPFGQTQTGAQCSCLQQVTQVTSFPVSFPSCPAGVHIQAEITTNTNKYTLEGDNNNLTLATNESVQQIKYNVFNSDNTVFTDSSGGFTVNYSATSQCPNGSNSSQDLNPTGFYSKVFCQSSPSLTNFAGNYIVDFGNGNNSCTRVAFLISQTPVSTPNPPPPSPQPQPQPQPNPQPAPPPPPTVQVSAVCGNGVCEAGESSNSCPADCKLPNTAIGDNSNIIIVFGIIAVALGIGLFMSKKDKSLAMKTQSKSSTETAIDDWLGRRTS